MKKIKAIITNPRHYPYHHIVSAFLVIVTINLSLFGFRFTEDTPCWYGVANFLSANTLSVPSHHCLYNPTIPAIATIIRAVTGLSLSGAYLILNLTSLLATAILIYKLTKRLKFPAPTPLLASLLFLTNFNTIRYGFAIMPDAFTWLMGLLTIYIALNIYQGKKYPLAFLSLFSAVVILSKLNLGFLFAPVLFSLFKRQNPKTTLTYFLLTSALVIAYFIFAYHVTNLLPVASLQTGQTTQNPTIISHATSLFTTYLYLWPFILWGIAAPKPILPKKLLSIALLSIIIPIIIWPYVSPRFYYTLNIFILTLAALGIKQLAKLAPTTFQTVLATTTVLTIGLLSHLRLFMTFQQITHLEFLHRLFS